MLERILDPRDDFVRGVSAVGRGERSFRIADILFAFGAHFGDGREVSSVDTASATKAHSMRLMPQ